MFNLYEFEKRVRSEEENLLNSLREEKLHIRQKRKLSSCRSSTEKNEEMSKSYKKRVAQFIQKVGVRHIMSSR